MLRDSNNTARKLTATDAKYRGLQLVWSRDKQPERVRLRPLPKKRRSSTLGMAAAAALGPVVWVGHAVLRWMKVL